MTHEILVHEGDGSGMLLASRSQRGERPITTEET